MLASSYLLDGPDDVTTAQAVADDLAEAKRTATNSVAAPALSTASNGKTGTILASAQAVQP